LIARFVEGGTEIFGVDKGRDQHQFLGCPNQLLHNLELLIWYILPRTKRIEKQCDQPGRDETQNQAENQTCHPGNGGRYPAGATSAYCLDVCRDKMDTYIEQVIVTS
jgi:hypothetical protein